MGADATLTSPLFRRQSKMAPGSLVCTAACQPAAYVVCSRSSPRTGLHMNVSRRCLESARGREMLGSCVQ